MGLLDDAIREHLELKRRRGADPDEVAREQQEALDPATGTSVVHEELPSDELASSQISGGPLVDPGAQTIASAQETTPTGAVAPGADGEPGPGAPPVAMGETAELDMSSVLGDDAAHGEGGDSTAPVRAETDSLEWEMPGDAVAVEPEEAGEDVLEETPDFLRDTPEQDRLWFEQRPPRDFDFDK